VLTLRWCILKLSSANRWKSGRGNCQGATWQGSSAFVKSPPARAGVVVEIAPHPQEMGAFGAALFALESAMATEV
jgi:hypothetical protein